jgi:hypothetical protein
MAKGQVSEEELAKGLKGIGNFGGLTSPRVRRDNPFRDSRTDIAAPEPAKTIEVLPASTEKRVSKNGGPSAAPRLDRKPVASVAIQPKAAPKERVEEKKGEGSGARKADIFTERVTLQISPEMRDDVERIAREIQRSKTSKEERITSNTVMRAAILLITKHLKLNGEETPNTEQELCEFVERMFPPSHG